MNDRSKLLINPEGETVGALKEYSPSERKHISELTEGAENVEILGTIVQVFEPRFFEVCPECGKRMKPENGKYVCDIHSTANPEYSYVMNTYIDDGTENIRCVFFRNQIERLLNKSKEEISVYRENPAAFEAVKTSLLGNMVKLIGRVNKNTMFDRLEFVSQLVFTNLDPSEEIKKIPKPVVQETSEVKDSFESEEEEVISEVEKIN
jgi:hypothetical protein